MQKGVLIPLTVMNFFYKHWLTKHPPLCYFHFWKRDNKVQNSAEFVELKMHSSLQIT